MNFTISEKMQTILHMMDEFVVRELLPLECDYLAHDFTRLLPELEKKRAMVKQMELWAPLHPPEYGGLGMTDDTIIAYFYRHERAARIYDGADEVHKLSAARHILKPYRQRVRNAAAA